MNLNTLLLRSQVSRKMSKGGSKYHSHSPRKSRSALDMPPSPKNSVWKLQQEKQDQIKDVLNKDRSRRK